VILNTAKKWAFSAPTAFTIFLLNLTVFYCSEILAICRGKSGSTVFSLLFWHVNKTKDSYHGKLMLTPLGEFSLEARIFCQRANTSHSWAAVSPQGKNLLLQFYFASSRPNTDSKQQRSAWPVTAGSTLFLNWGGSRAILLVITKIQISTVLGNEQFGF